MPYAPCSSLERPLRRPTRSGSTSDASRFPGFLSQLPAGDALMLDAGSSLNHALLLDDPSVAEKRLHIVTLTPEQECFWQRGISYVFDDLRALPFKDALYDIVVSVSTLEHVGCDNRFYTGRSPSEERLDDFLAAAKEMTRVLKPGGLLLLTVPYGCISSTARSSSATDGVCRWPRRPSEPWPHCQNGSIGILALVGSLPRTRAALTAAMYRGWQS